MNYINISAFLIGISTAFFTIFSMHILFWRRERTRFQMVVGYIMAVWAVWNLKDLIITFPNMYNDEVLRWVMVIDGWSAITYTVFVLEATKPGWTTARRLLWLCLPFAAFSVAYAIWQSSWVIDAYTVFLWCYAWTVVVVGYVSARRSIRYVRSNYSDIESIDVSWLKPVFVFAVISQLLWLATSLCASVLADIFYYVFTLALWLMVLHYSWNFHPITVSEDHNAPSAATEDAASDSVSELKPTLPFADGELEQMVMEHRLYLQKDLTLHELARAMRTNRTYITTYLNQVRHQTFYDFINELRIRRQSVPMMREHPEYTLEYVAAKSGFGSISTFRRAFQKIMGCKPSDFPFD